ncbi:phage tail protein, P2 protein I family [Bosea sp. CRIB-10]|uniref:phage tail protein I n=1 Tax=Bosea sp. CRIB-10 TaxID=378404 RepID=UPI0008E9690A|nr:phage tail protein I [Bosea sp. CRIB-10]SFD76648.1 phage tail protein, P2 protein I family [Bosea sp. CRIB-10]
MAESSQLPDNARRFWRSISEAVAEWWDPPVALLDTLDDAWRIPARLLPYLAAGRSVDVWKDGWTESKKRWVIDRWISLSRRRGVETTFAAMLEIMDARLVEFLAPPQGLFPRQPWTDAERRAWREQFPELRVYPRRNRHTTPRALLVVGEPWFGGRSILRSSIAPAYGGQRATIVIDGVERPVPIRVDVGAGEFVRGLFQVMLPTTALRLTLPAILGKACVPRASTAASRSYRYGDAASRADLLLPGQPISIEPERIAAAHTLPGGFAPGSTLPMILRASRAGEHVYSSIRIYDPAKGAVFRPTKPGGWILGRSKLRQAAFTLRLTVDASRKHRGGFVIGRSLPMAARGFDDSKLQDVFAAARAAKLGRDRVLVRTSLHRPVTAGDGIPLDGSHRLGDLITDL